MAEKLIVLDPTQDAVVNRIERAARPKTFKTVGLLDNGKTNSNVLLRKVGERLAQYYPEIIIKSYRKPDASRPAPPALLDQMAAECDVAIPGIGD